jgi:hypothetical protein
MSALGDGVEFEPLTAREREVLAQEFAAQVGMAAVVFHAKLAGRMPNVAARKALAEFVRAYTYALASPYAVDAEEVARAVLEVHRREAVMRHGPNGARQ